MTDELAAHDVYVHRDGRTCALGEDGYWWVPYDVGGEGCVCERQHGLPSDARWRPPVHGFGLLRPSTDTPDPLITGGGADGVD